MLVTWRKAAKDAILAADAFFMVFSFLLVKKCHFLVGITPLDAYS